VPRRRPHALLIDLDDVVRWYDPAVNAAVEARYGLAPGTVLPVALEHDLVHPAVTGRVSRAGWLDATAQALADRGLLDAAAAGDLMRDWGVYRGEVVPAALNFVREVRAAGRPVALTTNATDELDADLVALGLAGEFDAVVNSSAVGVAKPAPGYFTAACAAVGTPPERCLFVDDNDRYVRGARAAGLSAFRWNGPGDLPYLRAALDLDGGP
jgi:putative hydrolase of the HAD superfamily